ncbi:redoxin domain-containing protein [Mycolicibacterium sp. CH28]|uniref:redoxin domain-containing protein n=1 Tax=Mycolicibacterium sp. CH28 TaxID=2512237 RepID=UPI00107FEB3B|nr:redoxin domain-containing protein [Mycolicibacterium sp. CH28]TGD84418.1 redoxin domain-containing protein [Mycolicibacterium sp. CH28]
MALDVGSQFPTTISVYSTKGQTTIGQFLERGPLVVAFHRMWCPFCQQAARELLAAKTEFDAIGTRVVIVYREDARTAQQSCAQRGLPFACLSDPEHDLEHAADVTRFSLRRYLAFSPIKIIRALRSGSSIGVGSDFLQGRGTFVLDCNGRIVYAHRAVNASDLPHVADILAAARTVSEADRQI